MTTPHPAKYSDVLIPLFYDLLKDTKTVLDPMAGVGRLTQIIDLGYSGRVYCNELEPEWANQTDRRAYLITTYDARDLPYRTGYFDAICTSPTYANRMADSHNAKDGSKRFTYTHLIGRKLTQGNTGNMQWGKRYKNAHQEIWAECIRVLNGGGLFILNISDHIRGGKVMPVSDWHKEVLLDMGLQLVDSIQVETPRMRFGANSHLRVEHENVFVFRKEHL